MVRGSPISDVQGRFPLFAMLFVLLISVGTVGFIILGHSMPEGLGKTFETLAFMFSDDPTSRPLEIFLAVFGVFLTWWILWSSFDIIFSSNFLNTLQQHIIIWRTKNMKHHTIITGAGQVGIALAQKITPNKHPFIMIDHDIERVRKARKLGYTVIHGDASDETTLTKAAITHAKALYITMPTAQPNILVTLIARKMNNTITIIARCENQSFCSALKMAGANVTIIPHQATALMMAQTITQTS